MLGVPAGITAESPDEDGLDDPATVGPAESGTMWKVPHCGSLDDTDVVDTPQFEIGLCITGIETKLAGILKQAGKDADPDTVRRLLEEAAMQKEPGEAAS